jgi:hypothetical protein
MVNNELERIWKEVVVTSSINYHGILRDELRETTKNMNQESRCPSQDSNPAHSEYKSRALLLPTRSLGDKYRDWTSRLGLGRKADDGWSERQIWQNLLGKAMAQKGLLCR